MRNRYVLPLVSSPAGTVTEAGWPDATYGETRTLPTCALVSLSKIWNVPSTLSLFGSTKVSRSVGVVELTHQVPFASLWNGEPACWSVPVRGR